MWTTLKNPKLNSSHFGLLTLKIPRHISILICIQVYFAKMCSHWKNDFLITFKNKICKVYDWQSHSKWFRSIRGRRFLCMPSSSYSIDLILDEKWVSHTCHSPNPLPINCYLILKDNSRMLAWCNIPNPDKRRVLIVSLIAFDNRQTDSIV